MNQEVKALLQKRMAELSGIIFTNIWLREYGDNEVQSTLKANDFFQSMMTGKFPDKNEEWQVENTPEYKEFVEIGKIITILEKALKKNEQKG